jgi:DNA polymerase (family 10)
MTNKEIIKVLYEISELLEIKGENKFKIRAYYKIAQFLNSYSKELKEIYNEKGIKGLMEIPNIGEGIAKKIAELLETGKLKYLDELKKSLPEGVETFINIPGVGPKTAFLLADKFKIKTVDELHKLLKEQKLRDIKGFGEKTEEKILKGIELYKRGKKRKLLGEAYPIAQQIINYLKQKHKDIEITPAGSLRRMKETIGDIDILVASSEKDIIEDFCKFELVDSIIAKGETKVSVNLKNGIQADLRLVEKESFGSALQYFTGCKEHNVLVREIAVKKGYKLNEYGIFKGNKKVAGKNEVEVYEKLGLQYIPPELREGREEIKLAQEKKIPELVELKDIKGDLHIHSNYSDGTEKIEEIVKILKNNGYRYSAITDHSKSLKVARGLSVNDLLKQLKEIDEINKKEKNFYLLKGIEVDILEDGSLDYPDEILEKLDIVIGSVHTNFKMSKNDMTQRIIKALNNRFLHAIGHISGRLINFREPYEIDYEKIFLEAAKKNKAIEINANPERLDLMDIYIPDAIKKGVKLIIGTDAHNCGQFNYMLYGVGIARRGFAKKEDILNTWNLDKLLKWLKDR